MSHHRLQQSARLGAQRQANPELTGSLSIDLSELRPVQSSEG